MSLARTEVHMTLTGLRTFATMHGRYGQDDAQRLHTRHDPLVHGAAHKGELGLDLTALK